MSIDRRTCPDCGPAAEGVNRREFIKTASIVTAAAASLPPLWAQARDVAPSAAAPESTVKQLFESLSAKQREKVCFGWDHVDRKYGLLRTRVANNWHITEPNIKSDFYTSDQQAMIRQVFEGIIEPAWHERIDRQLDDDAGGYGEDQNIAIFGTPGQDKFEFVMTGRHMTLRCDGNSAEHVAFGGPIFYGHAAEGFNEGPAHKGNVFWHQAIAANKVFEMLDGKQRKLALVDRLPPEHEVEFRGSRGGRPGLPVTEMSPDQKKQVGEVLAKLLEPYHKDDRDEAIKCLDAQGGLDKCSLAFYRDGDIGNDQTWDCWRLEGPSFVWYYRGSPHVHVWVNVADNPDVQTNT